MQLSKDDVHFQEVDQDQPVVQLLNKHRLGKRGMFVVHMDRTSLREKYTAFGILLLLNSVVAGLFVWRLLSSKGKYLPLLLPGNMGLVDRPGERPSSSWTELFFTSIHIGIDCILAVTGKILLLPFVTGPLPTRILFGFHNAEPAFRVPTQSVVLERLAKLDLETRKSEMLKEILQAVAAKHVATCSADYMGSGIWTVDYATARDARRMLKRKELSEDDLELSVWQLDGEMRWRMWKVPN